MQSATALVGTPKLITTWLVGCGGGIITTNSTVTMPELSYFHCSLIIMGWNRVVLIKFK
jgi:hypothetical protein